MDMQTNIVLIKTERAKRGWTQSHLAEVCDLSIRTIQRIEKLGLISHESIQSLAAAFELKVDDLIIIEADEPETFSTKSDLNKWEKKPFFWLGTIGFVVTSLMHMLMVLVLDIDVNGFNHFLWFTLYGMWAVFLFSGMPKGALKPDY